MFDSYLLQEKNTNIKMHLYTFEISVLYKKSTTKRNKQKLFLNVSKNIKRVNEKQMFLTHNLS